MNVLLIFTFFLFLKASGLFNYLLIFLIPVSPGKKTLRFYQPALFAWGEGGGGMLFYFVFINVNIIIVVEFATLPFSAEGRL